MTESNASSPGNGAAPPPPAPAPDAQPRPEVAVDYMPPVTWKSIASVVVILALGLGSCAGLGYWGTYELMDSEATRWVGRYKTHPKVVGRLGQIERYGFDSEGSFRESNQETITYYMQGSKGRGQLRVTEFGMRIPSVDLLIGDEVIVIQRGIPLEKEEHAEATEPGATPSNAETNAPSAGGSPRE